MKKLGLRDFICAKYTELEFKLIPETSKAQILSYAVIMPNLYAQSYAT